MIETVQELIDRLLEVKDKTKKVESFDEFGDIKAGIELTECDEEITIYHSRTLR